MTQKKFQVGKFIKILQSKILKAEERRKKILDELSRLISTTRSKVQAAIKKELEHNPNAYRPKLKIKLRLNK